MDNGFDSCRTCALTKLLKPFFERKAKILMIVNLSPEKSSAIQSFESLNFADVLESRMIV
ncbi:unnamed protein product [Urochloa humidicola]